MASDFICCIRRDDFRFRSRYPYLKTRIYHISENNYSIFIENLSDYSFLKFEDLRIEFDGEIKMMGNPSFLIKDIPENYIKEIPVIKDFEISNNFEGVSFTHDSIINFLKAKFNNYDIKNMYTDFENKLFVVVVKYSSEKEKESLQNELNKLKLAFSFSIEQYKDNSDEYVEKEVHTGNPKLDNLLRKDHIMQIPAYNLQPVKLDFIKRDETLWFEKLDAAYIGEFTKDDLTFWDRNKSACYMDFTASPNIDLRNNLLMYDTIYISIPLKEYNQLLFKNTFTKDNFFSLIEKDRLKIINIQPEERLDVDILKEAYQINPNSVVSRRALSLLSILDFYEIDKNFIFNNKEVEPFTLEFLRETSKLLNIPYKEFLSFLYWPKQALRESFEYFNTSGLWAYGHIGINQHIEQQLKKIVQKDLALEFQVFSKNIHLANALNATYFPSFVYKPDGSIDSIDSTYSSLIGSFLNFYKLATKEKINCLYDLEKTKFNSREFISPIDIFDINTYIPFDEFELYTSSKATRNVLRVLFDRLSGMSLEQRKIEIQNYNKQVKEYQAKTKTKLLLSDGMKDITEQFIPIILASNPIMLMLYSIFNTNILQNLCKNSSKFKTIKILVENLNNSINAQQGKLSEIDILSQISRVARFKL